MIFQEIKPCLQLQPLVRNYLLVNIQQSYCFLPVKPYPARIEQAMVFFARGYIESYDPCTKIKTRIVHNAFFGQQDSRLDFQSVSSEDFLMLMVIFQPGAMHRLLGLPMHELSRQYCDAEAFLSSDLQQVNEEISNAFSYSKMIEAVEKYLIQKVSPVKREVHPIDAIGKLLLDQVNTFSLDWLACQSNLSPRQFERKFNERIGIGPKLFSRISRFFKAFEFKELHPEVDWLTIAIRFGYADYNHLVKDFKQFANVTPNIMMREYAGRPEAVL